MKKVRFNPVLNIIFEPENIANDLQKARMSDYQQKQADKARMERLLLSILHYLAFPFFSPSVHFILVN